MSALGAAQLLTTQELPGQGGAGDGSGGGSVPAWLCSSLRLTRPGHKPDQGGELGSYRAGARLPLSAFLSQGGHARANTTA